MKRPNILLIHTDQQRGDCLGIEGHPVLETPNMDNLALNGVRFSRFYSACPSCIASRRSILTGQSPQKHGIVGYRDGVEFDAPTLPGILRENGYQTYHIGRSMHQFPPRKLYGFDDMELVAGAQANYFSEYKEWFEENGPRGSKNQGTYGVGITHNDWTARPWHMDEHLHPSNWTVERALRFFKRKDPTKPFFLSLGFIAPHPPLQPPQFYFDRYMRLGVPEPFIGKWADKNWGNMQDHIAPDKVVLNEEEMRTARAAYYGSINHVDDLLRRIFNPVGGNILNDTIVVFTSDHGEMLGDHYMWRKSRAYKGSARTPFIITAPKEFKFEPGGCIDQVATHHDIMPTLLDMLEIATPGSVDGKSLYPLLRGEKIKLRDYLHIEHAPYHQCLTDGKKKFIWRPENGHEQFFDLEIDPCELHNAIHDQNCDKEINNWRKLLIKELQTRPEGFVQNGTLVPGKKYKALIPHKSKL
jgi:arylsulfatase A-like enzyme